MLYSASVLAQFAQLVGWSSSSTEFLMKDQEQIENLYTLMMSILVIYVFRNRFKKTYSFSKLETDLFFVFGAILICKLFTNWYRNYIDVGDDEESSLVKTTSDFILPTFQQ